MEDDFARLTPQDLLQIYPTEQALRFAAANGRADVVELLLEDARVDPSANNCQALCLAAEGGHGAVVELLLEDGRMDPRVYSKALRRAYKNGHEAVAKILMLPAMEALLVLKRERERKVTASE